MIMAGTPTGPLRDIGSLNDIEEPEILVDLTRKGQVYQATHDGTGNRLSLHDRSFISFSFGGKHIEDFDLIAVVSGDRMERQGYSNFEDTVSTYPNLDGQQYWSTHSQAHEFTFNLATDGIEQKTLDDFLNWFAPGNTRELILAEHPNRGILARVSQPPQLSLLPFEYNTTVKVSNISIKVPVALYKGEIELTLISDEPYWYSIRNVIPFGELYAGGSADKQILKTIYEDHIPYQSTLKTGVHMFFGDGHYYEATKYEENLEELLSTQNAQHRAYLYYAGTAPAYTEIKFDLRPYMNNEYITVPWNEHSAPHVPYNEFVIGDTKQQKLLFTTPNVYTSYNKAIELFSKNNKWDWSKYEQMLRDSIRHPHVRAWAIKVLLCAKNNTTNIDPIGPDYEHDHDIITTMRYCMMYFLVKIPIDTDAPALGRNTKPDLDPAKFTFNSETGEATGVFAYRTIGTEDPSGFTEKIWYHYGTYTEHTEDVGDMLRSNLIILRERNVQNAEGRIEAYDSAQSSTWPSSHYIQHNATTCKMVLRNGQWQEDEEGILNLSIKYKHMYL